MLGRQDHGGLCKPGRPVARVCFRMIRCSMPGGIGRRRSYLQEKKVAFLFLVGSNVATEPIWRSFFASDEAKRRSSIYVHPPRGFAFPAGHFFEDHVIKQEHRYEVKWASLQMVHAELVLLSYALRDPLNERFVLLSETDVPLWPFECTYSVLFASELSFLETKKSDMRFSTLYEFRNTTRPHLQDWGRVAVVALTRNHAQKLANQNGIRKGASPRGNNCDDGTEEQG